MDAGHALTNAQLKELELRIADEYRIALADMRQKTIEYLDQMADGKQKQVDLYLDGKITKQDYDNWVYRHTMVGNRWKEMRDVLAKDLMNADVIAMKMIKGKMPDVYALNANYGTYQVESFGIKTGFTLYNHDTAEYLLGDQRQLMPKPSAKKAAQIAANKDMQWNEQKIQSAVLQGVLQGENPRQVADRLLKVGQMSYNAAVRYARTMTTSAQNAGRYEAYRRATKLGVDLTIEWSATLDGRTRHDHRMMHGQRTTVDEPFRTPDGFTIYYPADCTGESTAPQDEIWNCRCTLLAWVKGFEGETVKSSPKMQGMTFEEWQQATPIPDSQADFKQYTSYKNLLGKDAPQSLGEFQQIKYNDPDKYNQLKQAAYDKRHPPKNQSLPSPQTPVTIDDRFSDARKAAAKQFAFRDDADKYWRPILDDNWDNLSEWEKYSTWEYTHNSNPINKSLTGYHENWDRSNYLGPANTQWGWEDKYWQRELKSQEFRQKFGAPDGHVQYHKVITNLTNGIEKSEFRDDAWLVRGSGERSLAGLLESNGFKFDETLRILQSGTQQEKDSLKQAMVGQVFQENSFLSTAIAKDAGFTSSSVLYDIYAPKGTKGIYAEPQSNYGGTISGEELYKKGKAYSYVGGEAEVILQRGSFYRITDVDFNGYKVNVTMEVYDQPDYFKYGDEDTYNGGKTRHQN